MGHEAQPRQMGIVGGDIPAATWALQCYGVTCTYFTAVKGFLPCLTSRHAPGQPWEGQRAALCGITALLGGC